MATNDSKRRTRKSSGTGFRISNGPVVRHVATEQAPFGFELPSAYGTPILFAIARDPRTLFIYWSIDWSSVFSENEPVDRQVHVRVKKTNGTRESELPVEPMLGNFYATVEQPGGAYRVELGYYYPPEAWNSIAVSEDVTMPSETPSENVQVDVATVPIHLSFQRMIDLFRAANGDELSAIISRLQNRVLTEEDHDLLSPEEWEILRAMNLSLEDIRAARRAFAGRSESDFLCGRAEAILGFGSSSPSGGFGGSSWS